MGSIHRHRFAETNGQSGVCGKRIATTTIRKPGLKHITIRVTHGGELRVSAPTGATDRTVSEAIASKERWIAAKLTMLEARAESLDPERWVLVAGVRLTIRKNRTGSDEAPVFVDVAKRVCHVSPREWSGRQELIASHLKRMARDELTVRAHELARRHGIELNRVYIRDQRTRWGTSSSRRNVSLNWRLAMAPPATVDYLILHELAHQRIMNHSRAFWDLLRLWCPDAAIHDAWLTEHACLLAMFRS